jgi:Flp pilus assembly protein TadB
MRFGVVFESVRSEMGTPEERGQALGSVAHEVAKGATLGFQDAIDEAKRQRASGEMRKDEGSLLVAAGDAAATGSRIMWMMSIGLGVIALVLALGLVWAIRKNRARRAELEQRDEALLLLTAAIKSTETEPWANELRAALKKSMRDRQGGDHIRKVLREKQGLRLGADALSS